MPHAHRPRRPELPRHRSSATRPAELASRPRASRARAANPPPAPAPRSTTAAAAAATPTSASWSSPWPEWRPCPRPSQRPSVALLDCRDLGPVPYERAWEMQKRLVDALLAERSRERGDDDGGGDSRPRRRPVGALILLQHEPVYTLGAGATTENLLFDPDEAFAEKEKSGGEAGTPPSSPPRLPPPPAPLFRVERGGEVTWHGPGQLVLYPILDLRAGESSSDDEEMEERQRPFLTDLHWYLRSLEEVVIVALSRIPSHPLLASFSATEGSGGKSVELVGEREEGLTGVWVRGSKAAALGVRAARWATYHGLALNVNPDLSYFDAIVPCGIRGRDVASVVTAWERELEIEESESSLLPPSWRDSPGEGPLLAAAADSLLSSFCDVLGVRLDPVEVPRELLLSENGGEEEPLRRFAEGVVRGKEGAKKR